MRQRFITLLFTILIFNSFAQASTETGFYLGFGLGKTSINDGGWHNTYGSLDDYKAETLTTVYLGYQIASWLSMELGHRDYGQISNSRSYLLPDFSSCVATSVCSGDSYIFSGMRRVNLLKSNSRSASFRLSWPFENGLEAYVQLGLSLLELDTQGSFYGNTLEHLEGKDSSKFIGFGLSYSPTFLSGFCIRLAWQQEGFKETNAWIYSNSEISKSENYDISLVSTYLGLSYQF